MKLPVPPRRRACRSLLAVAVLAATAAPALAAEPTKGTRILDACVYDLYFQQRSSENVTRRCRCVVQQAGPSITEAEAASYRVGSRLTGSLRQKIYAALERCR